MVEALEELQPLVTKEFYLLKELFMYSKSNTSNSLHTCTKFIQLLILLPVNKNFQQ